MSRLLTNMAISVIFAISIAFILIKKFRNDNIRAGEIWGSIFIGLFAIFPASMVEITIVLYTTALKGILKDIFHAFVIAAFVEETVKFLFVKLIFYIRKAETHIKGVVIAVAVGLGFALLENVMYSFDSSFIVVVRCISAVPLHITTTGIIGYHLYKSNGDSKALINRGLLEAVLIHGLYDFFISQSSVLSFLALPVLAAAFYRLFVLYRSIRVNHQK